MRLLPIILACLLGLLIAGPFGLLIGAIIGGFVSIQPSRVRVAGEGVPGHSPLCGCRRCLR